MKHNSVRSEDSPPLQWTTTSKPTSYYVFRVAAASALVLAVCALSRLDRVAQTYTQLKLPVISTTTKNNARIYIYPLPDRFTKDVLDGDYQEDWLKPPLTTEEYEADIWVYRALVNSTLRTHNPEEATLFYLPIFPTRYLHQSLNGGGRPWHETVALSADYTRDAILFVANKWPHWNQTNGRDHFTAFTADDGRCVHFDGLDPKTFGDMFTLQHHGDLGDFGREQEWPCYQPDRDILLPAYIPVQHTPITKPLETSRNITALYRFDTNARTAWELYQHSLVRQDLLKMHQTQPFAGSNWQTQNVAETYSTMQHAITCVTPPGIVAHTSRFYRAIRKGCTPITFFRAYELPFQNVIDYSQFTINVLPNAVHEINVRLTELLSDVGRLNKFQKALASIQESLTDWTIRSEPRGVQKMLFEALSLQSDKVASYRLASNLKTSV